MGSSGRYEYDLSAIDPSIYWVYDENLSDAPLLKRCQFGLVSLDFGTLSVIYLFSSCGSCILILPTFGYSPMATGEEINQLVLNGQCRICSMIHFHVQCRIRLRLSRLH